MEKLNPNQLQEVFKDVRSAYRLLALYQQRILDTVKYIGNQYDCSFKSGWSKFSNAAPHGNRASIDKWSWDWLTFYMYEFKMEEKKIGKDTFHFKIVHQADTGYYDARQVSQINKTNPEKFGDVNLSSSRLFFVISKNEDGYPVQKILEGHLIANHTDVIKKGNWLAVPYPIERFTNQESTDVVLQQFNQICKNTFNIELLEVKKIDL